MRILPDFHILKRASEADSVVATFGFSAAALWAVPNDLSSNRDCFNAQLLWHKADGDGALIGLIRPKKHNVAHVLDWVRVRLGHGPSFAQRTSILLSFEVVD